MRGVIRWVGHHFATLMAVLAVVIAAYAIHLVDAESKARTQALEREQKFTAYQGCLRSNERGAAILGVINEGIGPLAAKDERARDFIALANLKLAPIRCVKP